MKKVISRVSFVFVVAFVLVSAVQLSRASAQTPETPWNFSVSPTSGTAPLSVTATFDLGSSCSSYTLDWGDGSIDAVKSPTGVSCAQVYVEGVKKAHAYSKAGTYQVRFTQGRSETGATVTVKEASVSSNFSVSPTSGTAPLSVTATFDLGSSCSPYTLDWGDGLSEPTSSTNNFSCAQVVVKGVKKAHTYTRAGTYSVYFQQGSYTAKKVITVKEVVSAPTPMNFSVSPTTGFAPLSVTATFDLGSSCQNYSIGWGDGTSENVTNPTNVSCPSVVVKNVKKTHTYTKSGTYYVYFENSSTSNKGDYETRGATAKVTVTEMLAEPTQTGFSVSPKSGMAPLSVTATFDLGSSCSPYTLDWGDGSIDANKSSEGIACPAVVVNGVQKTHTYTQAGNYKIALTRGNTEKRESVKVTPLLAAPTVDEDQAAKISSLEARIKELLELLSRLTGAAAPQTVNVSNSSQSCISLSSALLPGSRGGEVTRLQEFLKEAGDLQPSDVTGYYGPLTTRAVQAWQSRKGVVSSGTPFTTGYGSVGPQTRALMSCR